MSNSYVIPFDRLRMTDVERVGGKNASLGELISQLSQAGVSVPTGFATTAEAYREFLKHDKLDQRIDAALKTLDVDDVEALARTGAQIRKWVVDAPFPKKLDEEIRAAFAALAADSGPDPAFAVRSSATAEDLPDASFAGQQETFLNVRGIDNVMHAIKDVFASLFNDRAISYRVHQGYEHSQVALSAGVQRMVRSDIGASGVMFTIDTESGFKDVVFITASWGLGEAVVQGSVNPDEFYVYKPNLAAQRPAILRRTVGAKAIKMVYSQDKRIGRTVETVEVPAAERLKFCLTDADVEALARQAVIIERHYGRPMDIEWGKDGIDGEIYILQARPETVKAQASPDSLKRYRLKTRSKVLVSGRAIGQK
ncbi:MAG TPA: PEP/pyruvate-binding domain-containing protein, partial [Nevskiales bacterium]|nr:PEP/pyruvate-binding domain-containing protein [Nevskiales bacterium]